MASMESAPDDNATARQNFCDALESWIRVALATTSAADVFVGKQRVWAPSGTGAMSAREIPHVRWAAHFFSRVWGLPDWREVAQAADAWPLLHRHLQHLIGSPGQSYMNVQLGMLTGPFIPNPRYDEILNRVRFPDFDTSSYKQTLDQFITFLESDSMTYVSRDILLGLEIPEHHLPLVLSESLCIERLSDADAQDYGETGLIPSPFVGASEFFAWPIASWFVAIWRKTLPKDLVPGKGEAAYGIPEGEQLEDVLQNLLKALAVTKFGTVGLGGGITEIADWSFRGRSLRGPRVRLQTIRPLERSMVLDENDCRVLQCIFAAMTRMENRPDALRIAQRRLAFAMEKKQDEDRFIDDMIAAEALFGDPGTRSEIKYKLALRAAFLLAPDDPQRRRTIFSDMKNAYDVRSDIVHGSKPTASRLRISNVATTMPAFVEVIENHIRAALRTFILAGDEVFPPRWDDIILSAEGSCD